MADALRSAVARAVEKFAAYIASLPSASSSSSARNCDLGKVQEDIKRLIRMLDSIRARLDDAEKREVTDGSGRRWRRELEGLAYDAEDVLDEFAYEAMRLQVNCGVDAPDAGAHEMEGTVNLQWKREMSEMQIRVSNSISSTRSQEIFAFLNAVEQRIERIGSRFVEIKERLEEDYGRRGVETPVRRPTSSVIQESCIFGRDDDLKQLKKFLLDEEPSGGGNIPVMAIVGMGGLGKTTLAQLAYNDDDVTKHFQLKSWVCVSEDFNLVQLSRAMVESLSKRACDISGLDSLQVELKDKLAGQRFLLVLDDVWEHKDLINCWETLQLPLFSGSKGSKVIVTTRSEKVSQITGATFTYRLPYLHEDDCFKLFSRWAFEGRDHNLHPTLFNIGVKVSKKCKGLPLIARTLGGLLCSTDDEQVWNNILHCDIWDAGEENGIMPILRLSYQHLPAHLKRCFKYCSVFRKDYEFDRDQLVWMWMAQGYIQSEGMKLMEDIGNEYFDNLLCRSFFQRSQSPHIFLMHDLIHDLARCVSQDECYTVDDDNGYDIPRHVRHLSIVTDRNPRSITPSGGISMLGNVRSLLFLSTSSFSWDCRLKLENDLFARMKNLRLLDLRDTGLRELPNSIGCLKHLRYIGLRGNPIKQLPESVGSLYNIQTLDLKFCSSFSGFSVGMLDLLNLRHLIHDQCLRYPVGIEKLTNLQSMPGFLVSRCYGHAKLGELKDINNIRSLVIGELDKLADVDEARRACLQKKEHLWALDLRWYHPRMDPSPTENEVLESLKPCLKLKLLKIFGFYGQTLPSWLGHPSFSKLACVELLQCRWWTSLPPLGQLPSLNWLSISGAAGVEYIGDEFFFGGFPRLETLLLRDMGNLKSWCGARKGECAHLRKLFIDLCATLASLSIINLDALESLKISCCPKIQFSSEEQLPPKLQVLSVHGCPLLAKWCQQHRRRLVDIRLLSIPGIDEHVVLWNVFRMQEAADACLEIQRRLRTLELVWDCNDGNESFGDVGPEEVLENLRPHNNLNKLVIQGYTGSRFATWLGDPSFNLVYVTLVGCSQFELLPPLGQLPYLKELYVGGACLLKCIGNEFFNSSDNTLGRRAFPSLEKLEFNDMPNWEEWVEMEDGYLPCLCELFLRHCPLLKALPHLPPSLRELEVANCNVITFPHSFDSLFSLRTFRISQLPILQKLPDLPLGLTKLTVQGLPALINLVTPPSLRDLVLEACSETMVAASLPHLTHLTSLRISNFPELIKLPLHNLVILQELHVFNCPKLVSFDCFSFFKALGEYIEGLQALKSLESLSIADCPKLHLSANERPPPALKSMDITKCPSLAAWHDKHWGIHIKVNR